MGRRGESTGAAGIVQHLSARLVPTSRTGQPSTSTSLPVYVWVGGCARASVCVGASVHHGAQCAHDHEAAHEPCTHLCVGGGGGRAGGKGREGGKRARARARSQAQRTSSALVRVCVWGGALSHAHSRARTCSHVCVWWWWGARGACVRRGASVRAIARARARARTRVRSRSRRAFAFSSCVYVLSPRILRVLVDSSPLFHSWQLAPLPRTLFFPWPCPNALPIHSTHRACSLPCKAWPDLSVLLRAFEMQFLHRMKRARNGVVARHSIQKARSQTSPGDDVRCRNDPKVAGRIALVCPRRSGPGLGPWP